MLITIRYKTQSTVLPRNSVTPTDLAMLFGAKILGMHLKINHESMWKNIWPEMGVFVLPNGVTECYLIAGEETTQVIASTSLVISTTNCLYGSGSIRGNNTNLSFGGVTTSGSKEIPSVKRIPAPMKKKAKHDHCFKVITISDIADDTPQSIYDVRIDLNKLQQINMNFGIVEIQQEIANQVKVSSQRFILTNKKGHPIRDMENTRGKNFFI